MDQQNLENLKKQIEQESARWYGLKAEVKKTDCWARRYY